MGPYASNEFMPFITQLSVIGRELSVFYFLTEK